MSGSERTRHYKVVELVAIGTEIFTHTRDVCIGDVLLSQELYPSQSGTKVDGCYTYTAKDYRHRHVSIVRSGVEASVAYN